MTRKLFCVMAVVLLSFLWMLPGCGKKGIKTEQVTGTVTWNGEPVKGANVTFSPVDRTKGYPSAGTTDAQGKYFLQTMLGNPGAGTTPGEYKVMITKIENVDTGKSVKETDGTVVPIMRAENRLPKKYAAVSSSPLTATVKDGTNTCDFDLTP
jgi:hypothetical protein